MTEDTRTVNRPEPNEPTVIEVLRALWNADIDDGFKVSDNFDEYDPLYVDVLRLIGAPHDPE